MFDTGTQKMEYSDKKKEEEKKIESKASTATNSRPTITPK